MPIINNNSPQVKELVKKNNNNVQGVFEIPVDQVRSSKKTDVTKPDLSIYYNSEFNANVRQSSLVANLEKNSSIESKSLSINGTSFPPYTGGPSEFDNIIKYVSDKHDISEHLIKRIIKTESNFKVGNVSHKGATGLMQLMPITAKTVGVTDRLDPLQNIEGGVKYLKKMLNDHKGDLTMALAAYNAGPGNVKKYGGIPPFKETQDYIVKILG